MSKMYLSLSIAALGLFLNAGIAKASSLDSITAPKGEKSSENDILEGAATTSSKMDTAKGAAKHILGKLFGGEDVSKAINMLTPDASVLSDIKSLVEKKTDAEKEVFLKNLMKDMGYSSKDIGKNAADILLTSVKYLVIPDIITLSLHAYSLKELKQRIKSLEDRLSESKNSSEASPTSSSEESDNTSTPSGDLLS